MIDVRITATNPEDSSLVPVPCNARGELLTVAPVIEVIPNDLEIQGDLTVTGLINGSTGAGQPGPPGPPGPPGSIDLPPDPYEGAILGWEGGQLAWISQAVVLPESTFGPYTYFADEHRLEVPQDTSELIAGRSLFMSDQYGKQTNTVIATDSITNVENGSACVLSFSSSNNFNYFAIGDVIGERSVTNGRTVRTKSSFYEDFVDRWENLERAWDGQLNTYAGAVMLGTSSACYFVYDFKGLPETVAESETVLVRLPNNSSTDPSKMGFTEGGFILEPKEAPPGGTGTWLGVDVRDVISEGTTQLTVIHATVSITRGQTNEFGSIVIVDRETREIRRIVDQTGIVPAEITDINVAASKITTNGGSFYGSDGSGTQGGAELLSLDWSGEGTVKLGSNGNLLLETDNEEWKDGFYVTAAEVRTAAWKVKADEVRRTVKSH